MKNAIILHGRLTKKEYYSSDFPSASNSHWLPWLQCELLKKNIHAQTPEVYKSFRPTYKKWAREIERFEITPDTILVGHSCGGGMIVQWLSRHPDVRVGKVVLVAPWIDVEKDDWPAFDFEIDKNIAQRTTGLTIFHSLDDVEEIQTSVKKLVKDLKDLKYVEFTGYGHFTLNSMKTEEFPELMDECLK